MRKVVVIGCTIAVTSYERGKKQLLQKNSLTEKNRTKPKKKEKKLSKRIDTCFANWYCKNFFFEGM